MADPVPAGNASYDVESVGADKDSGLTIQETVETVGRAPPLIVALIGGGANGSRIRLES